MSVDYQVHYCECKEKGSIMYDKITDQMFCGRCEGIIREFSPQPELTPQSILKAALGAKNALDEHIREQTDVF